MKPAPSWKLGQVPSHRLTSQGISGSIYYLLRTRLAEYGYSGVISKYKDIIS